MYKKNIRIIYASTAVIPSRTANSIQVMKMCSAFARQGNKVTLLACRSRDEIKEKKNIYEFYGVKDNFKIVRFPSYNYHKKAISKFLPNIYTLLCGIYILFLKPDIVYGRFPQVLYLLTLLGKKVVYEAHKLSNEKKVNNLLKSKHLKTIVVISNKLKEKIKSKVKYAKIIVAHDGADMILDFENKEINWPGRKNILQIGYIGHLYKGKGMEIILLLASYFPDIDFHIIGGLFEDIEYWKKQYSGNNIYFHGFVPHGELLPYYKKLEVFLAPYKKRVFVNGGIADIAEYMSPLKLFEYMAAGKVIVSSRLPVLEEVLEDGINALLCDPDNLDEWIKAIKTLLEDEQLRKKLGENAKNTLEKKYTWEKRSIKILRKISK